MREAARRGWSLLLIVMMCTWQYPAAAVQATLVETIQLDEPLFNVQLIVRGDSSHDFEVNLEMPDGTMYAHNKFDGKKVFYLKPMQERRWLINEAPAGEYRLHIVGEPQQYTTDLKEELHKPVTSMLSPVDTTMKVSGSALTVTWSATGDYDDSDLIRFYLREDGGLGDMRIGDAPLANGSATIPLPRSIADGTYELHAIADNKTADGQRIDPNVTLQLERGVHYNGIEVEDVQVVGRRANIYFTVPRGIEWHSVTGILMNADGATTKLGADREQMEQRENEEASNARRFRWSVDLDQDGTFSGTFHIVLADGNLSPAIAIPSFQRAARDWSLDNVAWSIEEEKTNERQVQVRFKLQREAQAEVVDGVDVLYQGTIAASEEETAVTVPLKEGDHILTVFLADPDGDIQWYSKRYLVDFTPPQLSMIQPLSTHDALHESYASGFTDPDSVVYAEGREIIPDVNGYFQVEAVGSSLTLRVRDSHGNETGYHWEAQSRTRSVTIIFIIINVAIIAATAFVFYWMWRDWKIKKR